MLARIEIALENEKGILLPYSAGPALQAVLMENIDPEYAGQLHRQELNPYSQYVYTENGKSIWAISSFTDEGYAGIMTSLLDPRFQEFVLKKYDAAFRVAGKTLKTAAKSEFVRQFYSEDSNRYFKVKFCPTAFKSDGRYIFRPDVRLIIQSLMLKYGAANESSIAVDQDMLESICEHSEIVAFHVKSTFFPMERVKIPAFTGEVTIKVSGNQTLANYVNLLLKFGTYSGIGIKSAMGMGGLSIIEKGEQA